MAGFKNREGEIAKATFFKYPYGGGTTEISKEEFMNAVEQSVHKDVARKIVQDLTEEKIFQIEDFTLSKGTSTICDSYLAISTYFINYVIKPGAYSTEIRDEEGYYYYMILELGNCKIKIKNFTGIRRI